MAAILIALALIAVAWLLSIVIRFALSRQREFLADAGSVELTKNPDAMISALRKIEGRGELEGATSAVMEMCVDNPREGFADLFATHPSIDSRIEALVKFAGGHDPGPLALPEPQQAEADETRDQPRIRPVRSGRCAAIRGPGRRTSRAGRAKPFLPPRATDQAWRATRQPRGDPGPWGLEALASDRPRRIASSVTSRRCSKGMHSP